MTSTDIVTDDHYTCMYYWSGKEALSHSPCTAQSYRSSCSRGLSVALKKRWKFPLVTWAHICIVYEEFLSLYLDQPITHPAAEPIEGIVSYPADTVLLPAGEDCVAVYPEGLGYWLVRLCYILYTSMSVKLCLPENGGLRLTGATA